RALCKTTCAIWPSPSPTWACSHAGTPVGCSTAKDRGEPDTATMTLRLTIPTRRSNLEHNGSILLLPGLFRVFPLKLLASEKIANKRLRWIRGPFGSPRAQRHCAEEEGPSEKIRRGEAARYRCGQASRATGINWEKLSSVTLTKSSVRRGETPLYLT